MMYLYSIYQYHFPSPVFCLVLVGSEEVFSTYKHRDVVKGCQPHPGDIVEAAPLAVSRACFVCKMRVIMWVCG